MLVLYNYRLHIAYKIIEAHSYDMLLAYWFLVGLGLLQTYLLTDLKSDYYWTGFSATVCLLFHYTSRFVHVPIEVITRQLLFDLLMSFYLGLQTRQIIYVFICAHKHAILHSPLTFSFAAWFLIFYNFCTDGSLAIVYENNEDIHLKCVLNYQEMAP